MYSPLPEARVRAQRFSYRDGLQEIAVGVIILLQFGGNLVIHLRYLPGIVIYLLSIFSLAIFARRIIDAVRARITYSRAAAMCRRTRPEVGSWPGWSSQSLVPASSSWSCATMGVGAARILPDGFGACPL
jgi:hypothetical protein